MSLTLKVLTEFVVKMDESEYGRIVVRSVYRTE